MFSKLWLSCVNADCVMSMLTQAPYNQLPSQPIGTGTGGLTVVRVHNFLLQSHEVSVLIACSVVARCCWIGEFVSSLLFSTMRVLVACRC